MKIKGYSRYFTEAEELAEDLTWQQLKRKSAWYNGDNAPKSWQEKHPNINGKISLAQRWVADGLTQGDFEAYSAGKNGGQKFAGWDQVRSFLDNYENNSDNHQGAQKRQLDQFKYSEYRRYAQELAKIKSIDGNQIYDEDEIREIVGKFAKENVKESDIEVIKKKIDDDLAERKKDASTPDLGHDEKQQIQNALKVNKSEPLLNMLSSLGLSKAAEHFKEVPGKVLASWIKSFGVENLADKDDAFLLMMNDERAKYLPKMMTNNNGFANIYNLALQLDRSTDFKFDQYINNTRDPIVFDPRFYNNIKDLDDQVKLIKLNAGADNTEPIDSRELMRKIINGQWVNLSKVIKSTTKGAGKVMQQYADLTPDEKKNFLSVAGLKKDENTNKQ